MIASIKNVLNNSLRGIFAFIRKTRAGSWASDIFFEQAMNDFLSVEHDGYVMRFLVPNRLCRFRAESFSSKEPETLEWIDAISKGAVLWDIGANVGLYTIYAAKARNCEVYAFEPSVFNLEVLARNIFVNGCAKAGDTEMGRAVIVPIALSNRTSQNNLKLSATEWGGALSTFGENNGWDGQPIVETFEYGTIGIRMDDLSRSMAIPTPDFIKIDVDGIEHLILSGGEEVLSAVKGVLIEVNDAFEEQATQCAALLSKAGLVLRDKRQSDMIAVSDVGFQNVFNQIWVRE